MAAFGSAWSVCRPIRKLGICLFRKKEATPTGRGTCLILVILVLLATGLTYTGLQSRGSINMDYAEGKGGKKSISVVSVTKESSLSEAPSVIERNVEEKHPNAEAQDDFRRIKENGGERLSGVPLKSSHGVLGYNSVTEIDKNHQMTKGSNAEFKVPESLRVTATGDFNVDIGRLPRLRASDKDAIEKAKSSNQSVSLSGEALIAGNRTNVGDIFQCPQGFTISDPDSSWFLSSIVQKSGKYHSTNDIVDDVLILTPISNVKRHLRKYFENICSLTYPHKHISIVLGEDSSSDQTFEAAKEMATEVRQYFKRVEILKLQGSSPRTSGNARHEMSWQLTRRRHMAMARNQLLFRALGDEKLVLWMDSDVRHIPSDLVERLLWPQKAIVVGNCLYRRDDGLTDTFDRNTWRDTEASKRRLKGLPEEFLMLEGYEPTQRKFLNDLKDEGDVVRLDGVGGCVLLVQGDLHRKGLVFPSFIFDHHIETEGLAKMAARMGIEMHGLPSVNVIHW